MHYYITGDTHRNFVRIREFCKRMKTTKEDVLIILGDAGINFMQNHMDVSLKEELSGFPITLFCIHGNHEARPWEAGDYEEVMWHGAIAYVEEEYPNLIFAKDGEIYDFNGKSVLVIGGAYSIDKEYRITYGLGWFPSEQPDDTIKDYVEEQLETVDWKVDIVLSHTVPVEFEPVWAFIPGVDQSRVDKSTENWLQYIYDHIECEEWYAGHYHVESCEENVRIMFEDYDEICVEDE